MSADLEKAKAALGAVVLTLIGAALVWLGLTIALCAWLGWYGLGASLTASGGAICLSAARDQAKADAAKRVNEGGAS